MIKKEENFRVGMKGYSKEMVSPKGLGKVGRKEEQLLPNSLEGFPTFLRCF